MLAGSLERTDSCEAHAQLFNMPVSSKDLRCPTGLVTSQDPFNFQAFFALGDLTAENDTCNGPFEYS